METDYISREAAFKALRKRQCEGCPAFPRFCEACKTTGDKQEIKNIPAADVRPVVRGHYVGDYDGYADGAPVYDIWSCSVCGCFFEDWDEKPTYNYCPNCGADMREESRE